MKIDDFPEQVTDVLKGLLSEKETDSIWFIGSRANGTEHEGSDWDFIAFVSEDISEFSVRNNRVDIIRVDRNWNYLLEGKGMELMGLFKTWQWREVEPGRAVYKVRVTPQVRDGKPFNIEDVSFVELLAINVWSRNE